MHKGGLTIGLLCDECWEAGGYLAASDFLLRDDASLSPMQWVHLDRVVADMVK